MKRTILFLLLTVSLSSLQAQEQARALAERVLGHRLSKQITFVVEESPLDFFELSSHEGKINIRANSESSLSVGLNHYLRHYAQVYVSWDAYLPVNRPKSLPLMTEPVMKSTTSRLRTGTYFYSIMYAPWWSWEQWERYIDWLALNGINRHVNARENKIEDDFGVSYPKRLDLTARINQRMHDLGITQKEFSSEDSILRNEESLFYIDDNINKLEQHASAILQDYSKDKTILWADYYPFIGTLGPEYFLDRIWTNGKEQDPLHTFANDWADMRSGEYRSVARREWAILIDSVFNSVPPQYSWLFALATPWDYMPDISKHQSYPHHDNKLISNLWMSLAVDANALPSTYHHDLVSLGTICLANRFNELVKKFCIAYQHGNASIMQEIATEAHNVLLQMDRLLSSHPSFLFGNTVKEARACGKTKEQKKANERFICLYYGRRTELLGPEGGLIRDYYMGYWDVFFAHAINAVREGKVINEKALSQSFHDFDSTWLSKRHHYPTKPKGKTSRICWDILTRMPEPKGRTLYEHTLAVAPEARLQDLYKSAFQDQFGPAHLITDTASCAAYIRQEVATMPDSSRLPIIDVAGVGDNYIRVNLSLVKTGVLSVSQLTEAVAQSAQQPTEEQLQEWPCRWEMMLCEMPYEVTQMEGYAEDKAHIDSLLSNGGYVMHHSAHFNEAYDYHYRLVRKDVFFKSLWPTIYKYFKSK